MFFLINAVGDINGKIEFLQNNTVQNSDYVSNHTEVVHNISIKSTDIAFLEDNNFTAVAFWFLNCSYYGMSPDLVFRYLLLLVDCILVLNDNFRQINFYLQEKNILYAVHGSFQLKCYFYSNSFG